MSNIKTQVNKPLILDQIIKISLEEQKREFDPISVINKMLVNLSLKEKEVINLRYGLKGQSPLSLSEIGKIFDLSRERIRQITNEAILKLKTKNEQFTKATNLLVSIIEQRGGIIKEEEIINILNVTDKKEINAIHFLLELSSAIIKFTEGSSWGIKTKPLNLFPDIVKTTIEILNSIKHPLNQNDLWGKFKKTKFYQNKSYLVNPEFIFACLDNSSKIVKTSDDLYGLDNWPEVNPKNIKDKIYFVLLRYKKAAHFKKITELILKEFKKPVNEAAVHNELCKDKRFVLIGRGLYALTKWGYKRGTTKEVILDIFKKEGMLSKKEIIEKVLKVRKVKVNTINLALTDKNYFEKIGSRYRLKEK